MNMSYCRFRNTLSDLRDCFEAIRNVEELSDEEESAKRKLVHLCKQIVETDDEQTRDG